MKAILKKIGLRVMTSRLGRGAFAPAVRGQATVFMMHRFRSPELGVEGHPEDLLRRTLSYLRKERYPVLGLDELVRSLGGEAPPPENAVVFTVDDGYVDQAEIGAAVFSEFDCPATFFLMTGFLDGTHWPWWDRVELVFSRTARRDLLVEGGTGPLRYRWSSNAERDAARDDFTEHCKGVRDADRELAIRNLSLAAEVAIPERAVSPYLPMTWDQARALERSGFLIGPHTVSHPVLSATPDDRSRDELEQSWRRVREELRNPVPVFCYPNGRVSDYGAREIETLKRLGFRGAVSARRGYARPGTLRDDPDGLFSIPRFDLPSRMDDVIQYVCGAERLKGMLLGGGQR